MVVVIAAVVGFVLGNIYGDEVVAKLKEVWEKIKEKISENV